MRVGVALGSNLGDRLKNLRLGLDLVVSLHEDPNSPAISPVYETEPVDCTPDSASFLNAVVEINCSHKPAELLEKFAALEILLGRPASREKNAPRQLDIDLLYAGEQSIATREITIPHPRLANRRFVLQPLADIHPDLRLPGQDKTIAELLAVLPPQPAVKLFLRNW